VYSARHEKEPTQEYFREYGYRPIQMRVIWGSLASIRAIVSGSMTSPDGMGFNVGGRDIELVEQPVSTKPVMRYGGKSLCVILHPPSGDRHAIQGKHQSVGLAGGRLRHKFELVEIISKWNKEARGGQG
jgi:hypothetical protein